MQNLTLFCVKQTIKANKKILYHKIKYYNKLQIVADYDPKLVLSEASPVISHTKLN